MPTCLLGTFEDLRPGSTGYSAFFSILGFHPETPLFLDTTIPLTTLDEHVSTLIQRHRTIYEDISTALHRSAQRMKFNADKYRREQNFTIGQMVKLRTGLLHSTDKDKLLLGPSTSLFPSSFLLNLCVLLTNSLRRIGSI